MIERLSSGPAAVTELARPTGLRLPTIMRHLAVLEEAGLVESTKVGRTRICQSVPDTMSRAEAWLSEMRSDWSGTGDRLGAFLSMMGDD